MTYSIGIDLGGSSVKAVAVNANGDGFAQKNLDFNPTERMDWAEKIRGLVREYQSERGAAPDTIGLSAPGLASRDALSIAYMPGRLHGLENLNWTEFLNVSKPVPILNDAHAALLGEAWKGAARGFRNVIMLTLGTGVGGAAIVDGKLLCGHIGRAGHHGHLSLDPFGPRDVCGAPGSLELAIGNCSILDRSRGKFQTTHALVNAHLEGDPFATNVWFTSLQHLAAGVCSLINILDPEAVIVGGGIARAGNALFQPLERFLEPLEWRPGGYHVKILPAQLGELAGAYGAAFNSLDESRAINQCRPA